MAGCGSEKQARPLTKAAYERQLKATIQLLDSELRKLGPAAKTAPREVAGRIERIQDELRNAADRLDEVEPPAEIRDPHDRLVAGLRELADDLDESREAAEKNDPEELREPRRSSTGQSRRARVTRRCRSLRATIPTGAATACSPPRFLDSAEARYASEGSHRLSRHAASPYAWIRAGESCN